MHYSPKNSDGHMGLAFLDYLTGNKKAALDEFQQARALDPNFRKQWEAEVSFEKDFAPIKQDKEFLNKLFPQ